MSKIMIWVGQFESENDFEKYMDQTDFRNWWTDYDEDNKELSCPFCKELGVTEYDEDFLIMKYAPEGMSELLNLIPADTAKIREAMEAKGVNDCNAVVCYECCSGISPKKALSATSVKYLGSFQFELNPEGAEGSMAGLRYLIWLGTTDKSREEFMEYFNQDEYMKQLEAYESGQTKKRPNPELRCQFCKDIDLKYYYPEFLTVKILDHREDSFKLVRDMIQNKLISDRFIQIRIDESNIKSANCIFCYIPNGYKDKKKDQKLFIKKKSYGDFGIPKKHVDELPSYNGIKYLAGFEAG